MRAQTRITAALAGAILLATAGHAYAGPDKIARAGERLTDPSLMLCDGGVRYWQGITEPRIDCAVEQVGFESIYLISEAIADSADVGQCIAELGQEQAVSELPIDELYTSNFYEGFNLWWYLAEQTGQTEASRDFRTSDRYIRQLFDYLAGRDPGDIVVYQNTYYDGGQSDFLYIADLLAGELYFFKFSCG